MADLDLGEDFELSCGCVLNQKETRLCTKHWAEFKQRFPDMCTIPPETS